MKLIGEKQLNFKIKLTQNSPLLYRMIISSGIYFTTQGMADFTWDYFELQ